MLSRLCAGAAALTVAAALVSGCGGSTSATGWQPASGLAEGAADRSVDAAPLSQLSGGAAPLSSSACAASSSGAGSSVSPDLKAGGTLFVSVGSAGAPIREFYGSGTDPTPFSSIDTHIIHPRGISVDKKGTLYVAAYDSVSGIGDVLEFPQGQSSPSVTLQNMMNHPIYAAADNKGNVYAINDDGGPIFVFAPGSSTPTQLGGFTYPTSLAFDSSWNMYVVDRSFGSSAPLGAVFELAPGSQSKTNLGLTGLNNPEGIAIDSSNDIFVSNLGGNSVTEYAPGATAPKLTITNGICDPYYLALNARNFLFVVNYGALPKGDVTVYKPNATSPLMTLTDKIVKPQGVAVNPIYPSPKPTASPTPTPAP
jgi:hypothetical protein